MPEFKHGRNSRSYASEAKFLARLEELGATLLEFEWLGAHVPHEIACAAGHLCRSRPHDVLAGDGICKTCSGHDPADAEAQFRARLAELGAELLEPRWLGARAKHHVRCSAGHDCYPKPNSVQQGGGVCWECSGRHPGAAEAKFRARVEELGGRCVYTEWRGANEPHAVICAANHPCSPRPGGVSQGQGICLTCAGRDTVATEAAFRARVAELGGTCLYRVWGGNKKPLHVRCQDGHDAYPRPADVLNGIGICQTCSQPHTVFYVLENASGRVVKFGVSSQEGKFRLSQHRRAGYTVVHLLVTGLADGVADGAENAVVAALALAGEQPVRGREYFDIACLALILDVATSWVLPAAA